MRPRLVFFFHFISHTLGTKKRKREKFHPSAGSPFVEDAEVLADALHPDDHLLLDEVERHGDDGQTHHQVQNARGQLRLAFLQHFGAGHQIPETFSAPNFFLNFFFSHFLYLNLFLPIVDKVMKLK